MFSEVNHWSQEFNVMVPVTLFRLVCGDVDGQFKKLFSKVDGIQKKAGQFDVCHNTNIPTDNTNLGD